MHSVLVKHNLLCYNVMKNCHTILVFSAKMVVKIQMKVCKRNYLFKNLNYTVKKIYVNGYDRSSFEKIEREFMICDECIPNLYFNFHFNN